MGAESFRILFGLGSTVALLLLGYVAGTIAERRHYAAIRRRERDLAGLPAITFETLPEGWTAGRCGLVTGSVVVSLDYFKRFLASLRNLVGGRLRSYESLLDRARREAILRMKEEARGAAVIVNVRIETSNVANRSSDDGSVGSVEAFAYGTAIWYER